MAQGRIARAGVGPVGLLQAQRERRWAGFTVALGFALRVGHAGATGLGPPGEHMPPTPTGKIEFVWDAPAGCPSEQEVHSRVESLLGISLGEATAHRLSAIARVRREGDAWNLRLYTVTPQQTRQRELSHEQCAHLADAAVMIVAVAIDPKLANGRGQQPAEAGDAGSDGDADAETDEGVETPTKAAAEPEPTESVETTNETTNASLADPKAPSHNSPAPALLLRGALAFGAGLMPRFDAGVELSVGVGWRRARLELFGRGWLPVKTPKQADAGAQFRAGAVGVRGGPAFDLGPLYIPLLVGVAAGPISAVPFGLDAPTRGTQAVAAASLRPELVYAFRPWIALWVGVEGFVALTRPSFSVSEAGDLHLPWPAGARAYAGLEFRVRKARVRGEGAR